MTGVQTCALPILIPVDCASELDMRDKKDSMVGYFGDHWQDIVSTKIDYDADTAAEITTSINGNDCCRYCNEFRIIDAEGTLRIFG